MPFLNEKGSNLNFSKLFFSTFSSTKSPVLELFRENWSSLQWNGLRKGLKMAHFGAYRDMHFQLIFIEQDAVFPQHFYNGASEILHIIHANASAEIGSCDERTKEIVEGEIKSYIPTQSKILKVMLFNFHVRSET